VASVDQPAWPEGLSLPEELLLVRAAAGLIRSRPARLSGERSSKSSGAARLGELVLRGRLTVKSERRRLLVRESMLVVGGAATGDALLDELLEHGRGDDVHDCGHWLKRAAKDAQVAYWDRLVGLELVRNAERREKPANPQFVVAARKRIRRTTLEPGGAALRDVAFVVLMRMTDPTLFTVVVDEGGWTPSALIQGHRDLRAARSAAWELPTTWTSGLDHMRRMDDAERRWAATAAGSIRAIAHAGHDLDD
jgi:hypothetical protein